MRTRTLALEVRWRRKESRTRTLWRGWPRAARARKAQGAAAPAEPAGAHRPRLLKLAEETTTIMMGSQATTAPCRLRAGGAAAGARGRGSGSHDRLFLCTVGVAQTRTISANAPQAAEDGRDKRSGRGGYRLIAAVIYIGWRHSKRRRRIDVFSFVLNDTVQQISPWSELVSGLC